MKIRIEQIGNGLWEIFYEDKSTSGDLGWDEMLALVASLTMPEKRPCLHWLKTKEEHDNWENYRNQIKEQNKIQQQDDSSESHCS